MFPTFPACWKPASWPVKCRRWPLPRVVFPAVVATSCTPCRTHTTVLPMRTRSILTTAATVALLVLGTAGGARAAGAPRQSHLTTVGVHNAYQKSAFPYLADALDSGAGLIELDVWVDSWTRQWRVNHELVGQSNNCTSGGLRTGS